MSQRSRSQILTRFWAVNPLARDEVHHSVWCLLDVPYLARLSRPCQGRPQPCLRRLLATAVVFFFFSKLLFRSLVSIRTYRYVTICHLSVGNSRCWRTSPLNCSPIATQLTAQSSWYNTAVFSYFFVLFLVFFRVWCSFVKFSHLGLDRWSVWSVPTVHDLDLSMQIRAWSAPGII